MVGSQERKERENEAHRAFRRRAAERMVQGSGFLECVRDILEHPAFQSMDQYIQHGGTTCLEHCLRVSYMSYLICRRKGLHFCEAARGGLLHDLFLYDWHVHGRETGEHFHGFTHPRTALENAEKYFSLTERERNLILRHMWPLTPLPPKYREGYVVIYADKLCSLEEIWLSVRKKLGAALKAA